MTLDSIIFTRFQMFPFTLWRISSMETGHFHVRSFINDEELYRVTRIYTRDVDALSCPFTLVRVDPVDCVNAASWYFIKGPYATVVEFAQDFSFGKYGGIVLLLRMACPHVINLTSV